MNVKHYKNQIKDMMLRNSLSRCPRSLGVYRTISKEQYQFSKLNSYVTFVHKKYYLYIYNNQLIEAKIETATNFVSMWEY